MLATICLDGAYRVLLYIAVVSSVRLLTEISSTEICTCLEASTMNIIEIRNLSESLSDGSVIAKLHFIGGDNIALRSQHPTNILFDNVTQEFKVKKRFNITQSTPLLLDSINITCTLISTGQEVVYKVLMEIHDENNNAPIFTNLPYIYNISEATPQGSIILPEITAVDADPSDAGKLTYNIKEREYLEYFNLTVISTGKLTLVKELNSEVVKQFNFTIQVKDNSYRNDPRQVQHTTQTTISINVVSIFGEDLAAVKTSYSLTVLNEQDITIDPSFRNAKELEFSLVNDTENDDWRNFQITVSNGLHILPPLSKSRYTLTMKVKKRSKNIYVLSIIFLNVPKPTKFLKPFVSLILAETTISGALVVIMETINPKKETSFYFIDQSKEAEFFDLDTASGSITIRKDLRNIQMKEFNLTVGLKDTSTGTSDSSQLRAIISTVMQSSPKFNQTFYEFYPPSFSQIGQVQATSASASIPVSYRLLDHYRAFSIDRFGSIYCVACDNLDVSTLALVVIAEAETLYNRSDSALVLVHFQEFQPYWKVAFIISIILALLFAILLFAILIGSILKSDANDSRNSEQNSADSKPRRDPVLENIQKKLFGPKVEKNGAHSTSEVRSVSSDVQQTETSSMRTLVQKESTLSDSSVEGLGVHTSGYVSMNNKLDRIDWTSSQDTINASNMTLTRPAVGTNGITLYY